MNLPELSLAQAADLLQRREVSPVALTRACLERIEQTNPQANAFITVTEVLATQQAHQIEAQIRKRRKVGALRGIPIAVKDLIDVAGVPTTRGNKNFADFIPNEDAAVFEKLRTAGMILLGKLNLHEIALGVTNENPHFGSCKNPWNPMHISGGSSGGCAVALALGMTFGAVGSDTGGSIRIPAALCGVVGLKPTYGRVSLRGVRPLSAHLDHVGPMARTVQDTAILFKAMAGYDPGDPYAVATPAKDVLKHLQAGVQGWRIALADDPYFNDAAPEVLSTLQQAAETLIECGAVVERVPFPGGREAAYANRLMTQADAAATYRESLAEHADWFGADVRRRLQSGAATNLAEYQQARRVQVHMRRQFEQFFETFDILLTPTSPITAPRRGGDAVESARQLTRFTAPFNLTGLPAISVPAGLSQTGLPIGLQMIARPWNESDLLRAAYAYEEARSLDLLPPLR
ncbi:MAG: amidase [Chloroflexota bacterium]